MTFLGTHVGLDARDTLDIRCRFLSVTAMLGEEPDTTDSHQIDYRLLAPGVSAYTLQHSPLRVNLTRITTDRRLHQLRIDLLPSLLHLAHKAIIGILIILMVPLLIMVLYLPVRVQLERHQAVYRLLAALGLEGDG